MPFRISWNYSVARSFSRNTLHPYLPKSNQAQRLAHLFCNNTISRPELHAASRGNLHQARAIASKHARVPQRGRSGAPRFKRDFFSRESWEQLGANVALVEALQNLGITRPSHIQAEALLAIFKGSKRVIVADQAGSGKTLAYLVPVIQSIKEQELAAGGKLTQPNQPRAVVLCPTEELCGQVVSTCRSLSKVLKFRAAAFTGAHKLQHQRDMLKEGVDIAICTPGRFQKLLGPSLSMKSCKVIVFDEVDVLLGARGSFQEEVGPLVDKCPHSIFVTATLPEETSLQLQQMFPDIVAAVGPNLHLVAAGVTEQLVDCSGGSEVTLESGIKRKLDALGDLLNKHPVPRTIVFCNKIESCRDVENFINRHYKPANERSKGFQVVPHHAAIGPAVRPKMLQKFLSPPKPDDRMQILVCTDRTSRGIDSVHVEHVVLFDFPRDPSEYVRRVGRLARGANGAGTVSVLVLGKQVKLAREVINRNQKGMPVHTVPRIRSGLSR